MHTDDVEDVGGYDANAGKDDLPLVDAVLHKVLTVVDRRPEVHGERRRGRTRGPADAGTTML